MPTFSYTSGNPTNLAGGSNASMADIQGPFVDLRTFLNGGIGSSNLASNAGVLETQLATGSSGMAKGSFSAVAAAATNVAASNVDTKITFGTEEWDTSGWFDSATNHRFQPLVAGYYRLSVGVMFAGSFGGGNTMALRLYKNGSTFRTLYQDVKSTTFAGYEMQGTTVVAANGSTDYFEIFARQSTAGVIATDATAGGPATYFQGELVGRS